VRNQNQNPLQGNRGQEPATIHTTQYSPARRAQPYSPLDKALILAAWGFDVLPLNGKRPYNRHGLKAATTNCVQINHWWKQWPQANCGARPPAWAVVLDIDPRNGGEETWAEINGAPGYPTDTLVTRTGSGGAHIWYRLPYAGSIRGQAGAGIDVKTHAGYLVMPGSIHPDTGQPYTVARWCDPAELPELPSHLRRHVYKPARPARPQLPVNLQHSGDGSHLVKFMENAPDGERNRILYWCARTAMDEGLDVFADLATAAGVAGLEDSEIHQTITSARRAGHTAGGAA